MIIVPHRVNNNAEGIAVSLTSSRFSVSTCAGILYFVTGAVTS